MDENEKNHQSVVIECESAAMEKGMASNINTGEIAPEPRQKEIGWYTHDYIPAGQKIEWAERGSLVIFIESYTVD